MNFDSWLRQLAIVIVPAIVQQVLLVTKHLRQKSEIEVLVQLLNQLKPLGRRDDVRTFDHPDTRELVATIYRFFQDTDEIIEIPVFGDSGTLAA